MVYVLEQNTQQNSCCGKKTHAVTDTPKIVDICHAHEPHMSTHNDRQYAQLQPPCSMYYQTVSSSLSSIED